MTIADREKLMDTIMSNPEAHRPNIEFVRKVVETLKSYYGIQFMLQPELEDKFFAEVDEELLREYLEVNEEKDDFTRRGKAVPKSVWRRYYDFLAQDPLSGLVVSQKFTWIMERICGASFLIERLSLTGRFLDVGCHTGYMTRIISQQTGLHGVGVDTSLRAIEYARLKICSNESVEFIESELEGLRSQEPFDVILVFDVLPLSKGVLEACSKLLADGGILLYSDVHEHWNIDALRGWMKKTNFGFGLVDMPIGGLTFNEGFQGGIVLALIKGGQRSIPEAYRNIKLDWPPGFSDFANNRATPLAEKFISYFRGLRDAGVIQM